MSIDRSDIRAAIGSDFKDISTFAKLNNMDLTVTQIRRFLDNDSNSFNLLTINDRLVGLAISGDCVASEVTLMHLLVDSEHRGLGLGAKLVSEILKLWKERGVERCLLEVRISNKRAQEFYTKIGFIVDGFRPNYYSTTGSREDAVLMSLAF